MHFAAAYSGDLLLYQFLIDSVSHSRFVDAVCVAGVGLAGLVEDVSRMHRWRLSEVVVETLLFCIVSLGFQLWVLATPQPTAVAFLPLLLHRAAGFIVDVALLSTGRGWAAPEASQTSSALVIARTLRLTDELACFLSSIMGAFVYATARYIGPIGPMAKALFFPLWLGTGIQLAILVGFIITLVIGGASQLPTDAVDAVYPQPVWRKVAGMLYGRFVIAVTNACSLLLAWKLDSPDSVTWRGVMTCCYVVVAVVSFPVVLALLLAACVALSSPLPPRVVRWQLMFSQLGVMIVLSMLVSIVMTLHGVIVHVDDASLESSNAPAAKNAILVPYIVFTVLTAIGTVGLFASIVPHWRKAFADAFGVPTPTSAALAAIAGGESVPNRLFAPLMQQPPHLLLKIGLHRYRRLQPTDDLQAFSQSMKSPQTSAAAAPAPAGASATARSPAQDVADVEHVDQRHTVAAAEDTQPLLRKCSSAEDVSSLTAPLVDTEPAASAAAHRRARSGSPRNSRTEPMSHRSLVTRSMAQDPQLRRIRPHMRLNTAADTRSSASPAAGAQPLSRTRPRRSTLATSTPVQLELMSPTTARLCSVCFAQDANAVLLECGHGGFCVHCCRRIQSAPELEGRRCPLCRAHIRHVVVLSPAARSQPVERAAVVHCRLASGLASDSV